MESAPSGEAIHADGGHTLPAGDAGVAATIRTPDTPTVPAPIVPSFPSWMSPVRVRSPALGQDDWGSTPGEPYGPPAPESNGAVIFYEPAEVYHSRPEPSASDLKLLATCPLEYHYRKNLRSMPKKDSPAMRYGERLHLWHEMLRDGQESFWDAVEVAADEYHTAAGSLSKKGEEWLASLPPDRIGMTVPERDKLWNQTRQILANPLAKELILNRVDAEFCGRWSIAGTAMRCRIDGATERGGSLFFYDLKTTSDDRIKKSWWRSVDLYQYDLQAAVYESFAAAIGLPNEPLRFIVTRNTPPHQCYVVTLPRAVTARAHERVLRLLDELQHRREWDSWLPEEYGQEVELECPAFMYGGVNVNGW